MRIIRFTKKSVINDSYSYFPKGKKTEKNGMKIIAIRHAQADMHWEKRYSSEGFDEACREYDRCHILPDKENKVFTDDRPVYISSLSRTKETAKLLFGDRDVTVTPLLDEVPLRSFKDTEKTYPLFVWNIAGRFQWFCGNGRQKETRRQTKERAARLISMLMKQGDDCILISHGWFLQVLVRELRRAGFEVKRGSLLRIAPLERIAFTEKEPHCGNCMHNCLLSNPGCNIGKEKALKKT